MSIESSPEVFADATRAKGDVIIEMEGVDKYFGDFHAKRTEGLHHIADLEVAATNQRGEVTSPGSASVILPSRTAGAVVLPAPTDALRTRGANMMSEAAERIRTARTTG
jgi:hypothetical protein